MARAAPPRTNVRRSIDGVMTASSAATVRHVAEGRDQQRHVVVRVDVGDGEPHRHLVQERWIGQRHSGCGEVRPDVKRDLVAAALHLALGEQRLLGAALGVRGDRLQDSGSPAGLDHGQLELQTGGWTSTRGVEHVSREAARRARHHGATRASRRSRVISHTCSRAVAISTSFVFRSRRSNAARIAALSWRRTAMMNGNPNAAVYAAFRRVKRSYSASVRRSRPAEACSATDAAHIAACSAVTSAKGPAAHACSATHGEFSKTPPNVWTKAARSMPSIWATVTLSDAAPAEDGDTARTLAHFSRTGKRITASGTVRGCESSCPVPASCWARVRAVSP